MWKLIRHAVPVDCRVRTRWVIMVSRCRCCTSPQEETLTHLFMHSEMAREVWRCFRQIFRMPYVFSSILQVVKTWISIASSLSQYDISRMAVVAHALHELWVGRCRATYDDNPMRARQICIRIIRKVQLMALVHLPKRPSTKLQYQQLELIGVTRKHVRFKKGGWFRWEAPGTHGYKFNIDGSARENNIT